MILNPGAFSNTVSVKVELDSTECSLKTDIPSSANLDNYVQKIVLGNNLKDYASKKDVSGLANKSDLNAHETTKNLQIKLLGLLSPS